MKTINTANLTPQAADVTRSYWYAKGVSRETGLERTYVWAIPKPSYNMPYPGEHTHPGHDLLKALFVGAWEEPEWHDLTDPSKITKWDTRAAETVAHARKHYEAVNYEEYPY